MKKPTDTTAYDLLQKTEVRISGIQLDNANLTDIAHCVASVIDLDHSDVLVVDYRDDALTLDILDDCINARNIVGREGQLRERLNLLPGVTTSQATSFSSDGMLGWISLDEQPALEALALAEQMTAEVMANISRRVCGLFLGP